MDRLLKAAPRGDRIIHLSVLVLAVVSGMAMASASSTLSIKLLHRHIAWLGIGLFFYFGVSRLSYRRWSYLATLIYALSLAALGLVLASGTLRMGARRWLTLFGMSLQPSEFAKLATIWMLARFLAGEARPLPPKMIGVSLIIVVPPALLVFLQPDLGSASIFAAIWISILMVAGISRRELVAFAAAAAALLPVCWFILRDYQRARLLAFIDPHADPLGAGYTIIQSTIAIGSGGLWGKGWFSGTQSRLSFLPERHSDFIFSVIGEEWGFIGCAVVIVAFGVLIVRALGIARDSVEPQGRLLSVGVASWIAYQAMVNMGMVMGLLPVVGVPLPLISYGGSSTVTLLIALGLLQSVHNFGAGS